MMNIRTLIIDDEYHAREGIRLRLQEYPEFTIVGECSSGEEAVEAISQLQPDLIFLDIQMPEMNGFEVLKRIHTEHPPLVIFVTAYDRYAIQAFEYHAFDYILKPVNPERFRETVKRVTHELKNRQLQQYAERLKNLLNEYTILTEDGPSLNMKAFQAPLTRILVKVKDQVIIIPVDEIDWIESAGDYIYIHTGKQKYLHRETLTALEESLDPLHFVRTHRSTIVNIRKVQSLKLNDSGDYDIFLKDGTQLKLSRNYKARFQLLIQRTKV